MESLDNYRLPTLRPWLFIVIVAIVGVSAWMGLRKSSDPTPARQVEPLPTSAPTSAPASGIDAAVPTSAPSTPAVLPLPLVTILNRFRADELSRLWNLLLAVRHARAGTGGEHTGRAMLVEALAEQWSAESISKIENELSALNMALVFGPEQIPEKIVYEVRRGDSISRIAAAHGTTVEMMQFINNLSNPNAIRIGQSLLVMTGRFEVVVRRLTHELAVYREGVFFLKFPVGLGIDDKSPTPTGTFRISDRIKHPPWTSPEGIEYPYGHPENVLGTHWMRIVPTGSTPAYSGLGIHGTTDDKSIGRNESAGCVRMFNSDVERLFALLPIGTPVRIVD